MPIILDVLYLLVLLALSPWLIRRALKTGRYRRELDAKLFGNVELAKPLRKPIVWFHGVSVGEIHLLATIIAAYRARHPNRTIVVSCTTDSALAEARTRFSDLTVIAYPFDFSWATAKALDRVKPELIVLAERRAS